MKKRDFLITLCIFSSSIAYAQQSSQVKVATRSPILSQPVAEEEKPVMIEQNSTKTEKTELPVKQQPISEPKSNSSTSSGKKINPKAGK
jgi:hypothetical protein